MIRPILNNTPYELFKDRKPNIMHLRVFGCKCFVHNNGNDALRKFDPRSGEAIFHEYSSHDKAYKVFNKRTLCVEESVHVLFDETNSLIENDAQDEAYELGFARKDLLHTHKKGRSPMNGSRPGVVSSEGGQGLNQSGGSTAEPSLEQNQSNFPGAGLGTGYRIGPETGLETGSRTGPGADTLGGEQGLHQTGGSVAKPSLEQNQPNSSRTDLRTDSRIGLEIGFRIGFKPVSPSIPTREESVSVDPLSPQTWKHQSSHPLDQILSDINTGVQTRYKLKNLCAFYTFLFNKAF